MIIRKYMSEDCKELAELFYYTVHAVNAKDYTKEQLDAWADGSVNLEEWNKSLSEHFTVVAIENNKITGFGDIDKSGYLDRLYVREPLMTKVTSFWKLLIERLTFVFHLRSLLITFQPAHSKKPYSYWRAHFATILSA